MGQSKLIHEHYDSKPWASIISATCLALLAIFKFVGDKDLYWINVVLFAITLLPVSLLLVMDIIWKKKPTLIVYNDRLEIKKSPSSSKMTEIMYSDIKNMSHEAGGLKIWLDVDSLPSSYYLGAKLAKDQENGIKPVPVESMTQKTKILSKIVFMITVISIIILLFVFKEFFH